MQVHVPNDHVGYKHWHCQGTDAAQAHCIYIGGSGGSLRLILRLLTIV